MVRTAAQTTDLVEGNGAGLSRIPFPPKPFGCMTPAMANTSSDTPGDDRNSGRDLLLGRIGSPGASRKTAAPARVGSAPSRQDDGALPSENVRRVEGLLERTAALEESLRETSELLERIAPAIDEIIQHTGDLSRETADATAVLTGVLSRLDGIAGNVPDAAGAMAPLRQDVARLAERIGELARIMESRQPGEDGRDGDVAGQVRLLGKMMTVRMDEVGRNLDSIRTKIASADAFDSARKRISRQEKEMPPPVPAIAVPDLADPVAMERALGVLGDLHKRIGIGLYVLEQALPQADRGRAIAGFRRKQGNGPRRRWLRRLLAVAALVVVTAWIEATWYPFGRILAWARYLAGWPL